MTDTISKGVTLTEGKDFRVKIADVPRRCGNCEHASRIDIQTIKCYGAPPVPVVIGGSQGAFGKVNLNVELMRPQLSVNEKPCGLWVLSQVSPLLNLPGMKSV